MKIATPSEKETVVNILLKSFEGNISVNYILSNVKKDKRLKLLMEYAFDQCYEFGIIMINNDNNACALILESQKVRLSFKSILRDIFFLINGIGLFKAYSVIKRQSLIKKKYPFKNYLYLWFIGVDPLHQNNGIGTQLLTNVITVSHNKKLPVLLETSMKENYNWYIKCGFVNYCNIDQPHPLHFFMLN